jgi:hypothetical protein
MHTSLAFATVAVQPRKPSFANSRTHASTRRSHLGDRPVSMLTNSRPFSACDQQCAVWVGTAAAQLNEATG